MTSKKIVIILVLFAIATAVGVYDNFIRKPQTYIETRTVITHGHTLFQK